MGENSKDKENFLKKVKEVNEIYLEHSRRGASPGYIYRCYIRDQFYISRRTFFRYLTIPYKRMLEPPAP